jgi:replicative DNA helicase
MPAGLDFLRAVIETGEWKLVRKAVPDLFLGDGDRELPAFEYVCSHLDTYGALPTLDVMQNEGHALSRLRRPATPAYYLDVLRKRKAHTEVNQLHPQFVECMRNQDMEGLADVVAQMHGHARHGMSAAEESSLAEEVAVVMTEYQFAKHNPGLRGAPTGWATLDIATNGLMGGDLVVIAGRPGMGKSWLLMEMANACHLEGLPIVLTSMEMGKTQLVRRWIGRRSGYNPNLIRSGELGTYAEDAVQAAADELTHSGGNVQLLAGNMDKSIANIESMVTDHAPAVLFVDAAYLLSPSGRRNGYISGWEKIAEVVRELKQLAIRYDIPVVISVQFNRNQKSSGSKVLDLGDIAGSDSIPQDASIVLGIRTGPPPHDSDQRIVQVMKNREGDAPTFATAFTFAPVSMAEVPFVHIDDEADTDTTTTTDTVDWMAT